MVRYLSAAGPVAKIELSWTTTALSRWSSAGPELHALDLKLGQPVYVRARKARVFITDRTSSSGEAFSIRGEGAYGEGSAPAEPAVRATGTA